jgi:hypothetical protein
MRKIYLSLVCCLGLFGLAACVQEMTPPVQESHAITASIAQDGPQTRAILLDNPGVRMESYWSAGDIIGIAGSDGAVKAFQVSAADISDDGRTAVFRSSDAVPSGNITAFFPYQEGAAIAGGMITMDLPATQHYSLGKGLPQPDPSAALMAGTGTAETGVSLSNVLSVLKVGQSFDEKATVAKVEFRDLDGKPVAGRITIDPTKNYASDLTGEGTVITLDCGEGVSLEAGELGKFYILVPAHNYPKGIEVTFVLSDGQRVVKTAGTTSGLNCGRGVVYPVGEATNRDYVAGKGASTLASGAILMTPEILRDIRILRTGKERARTPEGDNVTYNGGDVFVPYYEMLLPRSLGVNEASLLVFEGSDDLPSGGVFKVTSLEEPYGDENHCRVYLQMTTEFAKAFDKVEFGGDMFDAEGNLIEDGGLELDMGNYLSEVRDVEGNAVPFTRRADGSIAFSAGDIADVLTKAIYSVEKNISSPPLTLSYSSGACTASLGAVMNVGMRAACKIDHGELQYVNFTFHPTLDLNVDFTLEKEFSFSKEVYLFTLYFVPGIPIAPGVILTPQIEFRASFGASANVTLTTSIKYSYDMGRFGFSYQPEMGFMFRNYESAPKEADPKPKLGASLQVNLAAWATLTVEPSISLYGLFGAGLCTDFTLTLKNDYDINSYGGRVDPHVDLVPSLKFTPRTASLGGVFSKKWDILAAEIPFDPIWTRYLTPVVNATGPSTHLAADAVSWWFAKSDMYYDNDAKHYVEGIYKKATGTGYYLISMNDENYPTWWVNGNVHGHYTEDVIARINGVAYNLATNPKKPLLQEWRIVCDIELGVSNESWERLVGLGAGQLAHAYVDEDLAYSHGEINYTDRGKIARYDIMDIPAGPSEMIAVVGIAGSAEDFPERRIRSYSIVAIHKATGLEYPLYQSPPFTFYWPDSPSGPIFTKHLLGDEYVKGKDIYDRLDVYEWPDNMPLP